MDFEHFGLGTLKSAALCWWFQCYYYSHAGGRCSPLHCWRPAALGSVRPEGFGCRCNFPSKLRIRQMLFACSSVCKYSRCVGAVGWWPECICWQMLLFKYFTV